MPLTWDGLKACRALRQLGHKVNVTLCFSANQALLAAKAGASFISPFIGRLDDINLEGMDSIEDIRTIYDNYDYDTQILAARPLAEPREAGGDGWRRRRDRSRRGAEVAGEASLPTRGWNFSCGLEETGQSILLARRSRESILRAS